MSTTYSPRVWVNDWKRLLEKPENLFFVKDIPNIAEYLSESTKMRKCLGKYEKKIVKTLKNKIRENGPDKKIIDKCQDGLLEEILECLQEENVDCVRLHDALVKVNRLLSSNILFDKIKEILKDAFTNEDGEQAQYAVYLLVRSQLNQISLKHLKELETLPRKIFAKVFFTMHQDKITRSILELDPIKPAEDDFLSIIVDIMHSENAKLHNSNIDFLAKVFHTDPYFERETYSVSQKILQNLKNSQELDTYFSHMGKPNTQSFSDFLKTNNTIKEEFDELINGHVFALVYSLLVHYLVTDRFFKGHSKYSDSKLCKLISEQMQKIIYEGRGTNFQSNFLYPISDSAVFTFIRKFSEYYSQTIELKERSKCLDKITGIFADRVLAVKQKQKNSNTSDLENFSNDFQLKIQLRQTLNGFIENNMKDILQHIQIFEQTQLDQNFKDELLESQIKEIFQILPSEYYFYSLPDQVSADIMIRLIDGFIDELKKPSTKYRIFFLISDLDLDGSVARLGSVVMYDPRRWDFGEGDGFDDSYKLNALADLEFSSEFYKYDECKIDEKTYELKRNSARAFVDVESVDPQKAKLEAINMVRNAMDPLVFMFSKKGFRPEIPTLCVVLDKDSNHKGQSWWRKTDTVENKLKISDEETSYLRNADKLLQDKTKFKEPLLRSLTWFQKGYWEHIPHHKFVSYWIALEQVIMSLTSESKKKPTLLEIIPKIAITWRETPQSYFINMLSKRIFETIDNDCTLQSKIEAVDEFKCWKKNRFILLENIQKLEEISNGSLSTLLDQIKEYFTDEAICSIWNSVDSIREMEKFKIAFLYAKRNSIFHEGVTDSALTEIFTFTLENLLVVILYRIWPMYEEEDINSIINELERPWAGPRQNGTDQI